MPWSLEKPSYSVNITRQNLILQPAGLVPLPQRSLSNHALSLLIVTLKAWRKAAMPGALTTASAKSFFLKKVCGASWDPSPTRVTAPKYLVTCADRNNLLLAVTATRVLASFSLPFNQ